MNSSAVRAIVTGGASGLGLATARRLAAAGGKVVIADLNASELPSLSRAPPCTLMSAGAQVDRNPTPLYTTALCLRVSLPPTQPLPLHVSC